MTLLQGTYNRMSVAFYVPTSLCTVHPLCQVCRFGICFLHIHPARVTQASCDCPARGICNIGSASLCMCLRHPVPYTPSVRSVSLGFASEVIHLDGAFSVYHQQLKRTLKIAKRLFQRPLWLLNPKTLNPEPLTLRRWKRAEAGRSSARAGRHGLPSAGGAQPPAAKSAPKGADE